MRYDNCVMKQGCMLYSVRTIHGKSGGLVGKSSRTLKYRPLCGIRSGPQEHMPSKSDCGHPDAYVERRKRIVDKVLSPLDKSMKFCIVCGTGDSQSQCPRCDGNGWVLTRPGGGGVVGEVRRARCKICGGSGIVPCILCGGCH